MSRLGSRAGIFTVPSGGGGGADWVYFDPQWEADGTPVIPENNGGYANAKYRVEVNPDGSWTIDVFGELSVGSALPSGEWDCRVPTLRTGCETGNPPVGVGALYMYLGTGVPTVAYSGIVTATIAGSAVPSYTALYFYVTDPATGQIQLVSDTFPGAAAQYDRMRFSIRYHDTGCS
jgi:hypothetical protein